MNDVCADAFYFIAGGQNYLLARYT
jgi:hypothetical protein